MLTPADPETFWLNVTNIGLGLATLFCMAVVAWAVAHEALVRLRSRVALRQPVPGAADPHVVLLPELGLTMADGGEKVDETKGKR